MYEGGKDKYTAQGSRTAEKDLLIRCACVLVPSILVSCICEMKLKTIHEKKRGPTEKKGDQEGQEIPVCTHTGDLKTSFTFRGVWRGKGSFSVSHMAMVTVSRFVFSFLFCFPVFSHFFLCRGKHNGVLSSVGCLLWIVSLLLFLPVVHSSVDW